MSNYAKVVIKGSPITKSNFKLHNMNGRAILPDSSGKYHDRYALYEQEIALIARSQNPDIIFSESLIALLKVYYKSEKRHPDTINITKSIFDGIEKSGLIVNDAQITKIFTEEYYDKENPRFELELFSESEYNFNYTVTKKAIPTQPKSYSPQKKTLLNNLSTNHSLVDNLKNKINAKPIDTCLREIDKASKCTVNNKAKLCNICSKLIISDDYIKADSGKTLICKKCFNKLF
ncbi:crossover junction endodeoxyribonuclease RuvA [Clostridium gelidum]|uniref:Crossover junction endodeoxyribonuclease RuvA n=1 Tax=Clostridium gelidum TaxID=704125 RepID=A0ABN6IUK2_9CLOT|nr:RusA family crossover junction endodeoxyribonuclease [Clostridium gelidum]BCZ44371.1 crossover junction endodeoxyribonuclease RuvA [Clostridium gelidum]